MIDVRDVIDGQDPKVPVLRYTLDIPSGGGRGIGVSGTHVYTAGDSFQVIDLGD